MTGDDRLVFERFHAAFDVEANPALREQIRARLLASDARTRVTPRFGGRRHTAPQRDVSARAERGVEWQLGTPSLRWAVGLVALLLTVALLASLLYYRGGLNHVFPPLPVPAGPRACPSTPAPTPQLPIARGDLQAVTGVSDPKFMTAFDLKASIQAQKITLVGAYADPLTTVLILEMDQADSREWTLDFMRDDQGRKIPGGTGVFVPAGQHEALVFTLPGPSGYGADGIAHLMIQLGLLTAAPPAGGTEPVEDTPAGTASLTFSLCVHPAIALPVPPAFRLGPGTVTIRSLEISPAALRMQAVFDGVGDAPVWTGGNFSNFGLYRADPPCPSLPDVNVLDTTCLIDFATGQLGPQFGPLQGTTYVADVRWLRPAAGHYMLVFRSGGGASARQLQIPALEDT